MTSVERRIEAPTHREPDYAGKVVDAERGFHRKFVGGKWEEMGRLQLDFLVEHGLRPTTKFLDVGCGSLRAGRLLVDYLDPGNYYGIDINPSVIEAGYDQELDDAGRDRLPISHLRATDRFDADFGVTFDMAIAQSLFTHLTLNNIRLCLHRVAKVVRPEGRFYVTFFERPPHQPVDFVGEKRRQWAERNPYSYYREDLRWAVRRLPWRFRYIGDWDHPRGQRMVEYTRLSDDEAAAPRRTGKSKRLPLRRRGR